MKRIGEVSSNKKILVKNLDMMSNFSINFVDGFGCAKFKTFFLY